MSLSYISKTLLLSKNIEEKYHSNTNFARDKKIFGSPSFIIDNEIFWGDDRMEDAIKWLKKNVS